MENKYRNDNSVIKVLVAGRKSWTLLLIDKGDVSLWFWVQMVATGEYCLNYSVCFNNSTSYLKEQEELDLGHLPAELFSWFYTGQGVRPGANVSWKYLVPQLTHECDHSPGNFMLSLAFYLHLLPHRVWGCSHCIF